MLQFSSYSAKEILPRNSSGEAKNENIKIITGDDLIKKLEK